MSEAVAVALITGACAVIAQVILTRQASTRTLAEIEKRSEISDVRMEERWKVLCLCVCRYS